MSTPIVPVDSAITMLLIMVRHTSKESFSIQIRIIDNIISNSNNSSNSSRAKKKQQLQPTCLMKMKMKITISQKILSSLTRQLLMTMRMRWKK